METGRLSCEVLEWCPEGNKERCPIAKGQVIGRITQLTETIDIPVTVVRFGEPMTTLPSGKIGLISPLHHVYVYRQGCEPRMILTRLNPFQYEHVLLSELEMAMILSWGKEMADEHIGEFTPSDGGWFWWVRRSG